VTRDQEEVDPICVATCAPTTTDSGVLTSGYCRLATAGAPVCAAAAPVHTVVWANPAVSLVEYSSDAVAAARPGDYIAFEWDDALHEVRLVPSDAEDPCDLANTTFVSQVLIPASHHATIDPETEDTVVAGRNLFRIPESAAGTVLVFACWINGHCQTGQVLSVQVGSQPATPNPALATGVCEKDYKLCPDQSVQGATTASVETSVNVPYQNPLAAYTLQLAGEVTRASTPWDQWARRAVRGKVCRSRPQNARVSNRAWAVAGADWGGRAVWDFPDHTLREVLDACSSSYPEVCTGISWGGGGVNSTLLSPNSPKTYSDIRRPYGNLGDTPGWIPASYAGAWMQLDLGEDRNVVGLTVQARQNSGAQGVTKISVQYSSDGEHFADMGGIVNTFSVEELVDNYAADGNGGRRKEIFFPVVIRGRYIRLTQEGYYHTPVLRAEALLFLNPDVTSGKHTFRRCLESDQYTRLVSVGALADSDCENFTVPRCVAREGQQKPADTVCGQARP
jgi:hypothetical protein